MAIGFLRNGVPLKPVVSDNATDGEIERWWRDRLDLSSAETREVYDRYNRDRD